MTGQIIYLPDIRQKLKKEKTLREYIKWFDRRFPHARDPEWHGEWPPFDPLANVNGAPSKGTHNDDEDG
jgi:hypothetical protein